MLAGRREKLANLQDAGVIVALAPTQCGVANGFRQRSQGRAQGFSPHWTPWGYQQKRAWQSATTIQRRNSSNTATMIPGWGRRVAGFRELAAEASVALSDVLYVGNRPEDKQAAASAGVSFRWAEDYFAAGDGE